MEGRVCVYGRGRMCVRVYMGEAGCVCVCMGKAGYVYGRGRVCMGEAVCVWETGKTVCGIQVNVSGRVRCDIQMGRWRCMGPGRGVARPYSARQFLPPSMQQHFGDVTSRGGRQPGHDSRRFSSFHYTLGVVGFHEYRLFYGH